LCVWVGVIAWNARRELFRPAAERLALGAATLPPGVAYYFIDSGLQAAGWASIEFDTLAGRSGFLIREQYDVRLPGLGEAGHVETRGQTWLDARVELDSLSRSIVRGSDTVLIWAAVRGDSLDWRSSGDPEGIRLPAAEGLQIAASWPLRFAASGGAADGEIRRLTLFDPISGTLREVDVRSRGASVRVFADSADTDPESGEWFIAGRDTVNAWWVEEVGGTAAPTWVDEDGRILEADLPGALRLRRTAFELAFFRNESIDE
ncbi:MAG: hypothetical protein OEM96_07575, partial [Gemmatimonadota bacterium]|nr:hypothetical protein [Gemmatimonadota bacterium]